MKRVERALVEGGNENVGVHANLENFVAVVVGVLCNNIFVDAPEESDRRDMHRERLTIDVDGIMELIVESARLNVAQQYSTVPDQYTTSRISRMTNE
jgi:hypothetical protein